MEAGGSRLQARVPKRGRRDSLATAFRGVPIPSDDPDGIHDEVRTVQPRLNHGDSEPLQVYEGDVLTSDPPYTNSYCLFEGWRKFTRSGIDSCRGHRSVKETAAIA
jgi:hypothetical protein